MTLIASIFSHGSPVLLGDLILSREMSPKHNVVSPINVFGQDDNPRSKPVSVADSQSKRIPNELKQKLVLIGKEVALGWSGDEWKAADFLHELKPFSASKKFSVADFLQVFDTISNKYRDYINVIAYVWNRENNAFYDRCFGHDIVESRNNVHGIVRTSGSGRDLFDLVLEELSASRKPINRPITEAEHAKHFPVALASRMIAEERRQDNTFKKNFGGGYEIIIHTDDGFSKLDNIAYVIWKVKVCENDEVRVFKTPVAGYFQKYIDDKLVIRTFEYEPVHRFELSKGHDVDYTTKLSWVNSLLGNDCVDENDEIEYDRKLREYNGPTKHTNIIWCNVHNGPLGVIIRQSTKSSPWIYWGLVDIDTVCISYDEALPKEIFNIVERAYDIRK